MTRFGATLLVLLGLSTACYGPSPSYDYETVADGVSPQGGTSHLLGIRAIVRNAYEQAPSGKVANFVYTREPGGINFTGTGTTLAAAAQSADTDLTTLYDRFSQSAAAGDAISTTTEPATNTATAPRRTLTWSHAGVTETISLSVDRLP
jgi:hypothetical protein